MSTVLRWSIDDPFDTNSATNHYTFPRNPSEMTSIHEERSVSSMTTTAGVVMLYEGQTPAKEWQFSGPLLDKTQYADLYEWVYNKRRRVVLNDHFGRAIHLVFKTLEATPKRRVNYYYSHDYVVSALILYTIHPTGTVPNKGPLI